MPALPEPESGVFLELQFVRCLDALRGTMPTGRVRVDQSAGERSLWLEDGNVKGIASTLEEEKLGSWLVARGVVPRTKVDSLRAGMKAGERLGSVLMREALLDEGGLREAIDDLTAALCERILLEEGTYRTEPGTLLPPDACTVDSPPAPLFVAAVRRTKNLDAFEPLLGRGRRWEAVDEPQRTAVALSSVERYVLSHLRPARALDDLRGLLPGDFDEIVRALGCLATAGMASPLRGYASSVDAAQQDGPAGAGDEGDALGSDEETGASPFPPASPRLHALFTRLEPATEAGPRRLPTGERVPTPAEQRKAEAFKKTALHLLLGDGNRAQAFRLLAQAAQLSPEPDILVALATLELEEQRWWPRALRHLKQALESAPTHTEGWLALASYWRLRAQPGKERYCLEKILAYDPGNREASRLLGEIAG
jgi:tetratricopeptide (TPR) repeat protein